MASSFVIPTLLGRRYLAVKRHANILVSPRNQAGCVIARMGTIGARVRFLRKKRGYSQVELAGLVGISQGSLSLIERNETEMPAGATLAGLCKALKTTPDFLIAGAGDPDSIESAFKEHELVFLWRELPEEARQLVLDSAHAIRRAFVTSKTRS